MSNPFSGAIQPVSSTRYAAPDISKLLYEGIGNLPQDYYQGQKSAQELALSQSLPQGLAPYWSKDPRTGQMVFDAYRYANDQARIGGPAQAAPYVNALMGAQYGAQQNQALAGVAGVGAPGGGGLPPGWGPPGTSQPPQPPPRSPPQTASPQSNILPGPQSSTAQPPEPTGGMDYLAGMATEHYGSDTPAEGAINKVASALKVTPDQTLSPQQIQRASQLFASLSPDGRVQIRPAGSKPDTDPTSGPQATFGPSEESAGAPRTYSPGVSGTPGPAPEAPIGGPGPGAVTPQGIIPNRVTSTPITPASANVRTAGGPLSQPAAPPAQAQAPLAGAGGRLIDVPLPRIPRELESLRQRALQARLIASNAALNLNQQMGKIDAERANSVAQQLQKEYETRLESLYNANKLTPEAVDAYRGLTGLVAAHKSALEQGTETGKANAKMASDIDTLGYRSRQDIKHLEHADNLIDQKGSYVGPFHDLVQHFQNAEWLLGGDRTAATPNQMLIKEFANAELAAIRDLGNSGLGRILFREVEAVQRTIMNMGQTPETARQLLEIAMRTRRLQMKAQDMLRDNNGVVDEKLKSQLMEYYDKNPLITPAEMEDSRLIAPPRMRKGTTDEYRSLGINPGDPVRMWSEKDKSWKIRNAPAPSQ